MTSRILRLGLACERINFVAASRESRLGRADLDQSLTQSISMACRMIMNISVYAIWIPLPLVVLFHAEKSLLLLSNKVKEELR